MLLIVHGGAGSIKPQKKVLKKLSESLSSGRRILIEFCVQLMDRCYLTMIFLNVLIGLSILSRNPPLSFVNPFMPSCAFLFDG
jgi:hypothetical protein